MPLPSVKRSLRRRPVRGLWALCLLGLLGAPWAWGELIPVEPEALGPLGQFRSLAELWGQLSANTADPTVTQPALDTARQALWCLAEAKAALEQGAADKAREASHQAKQQAWQAYWQSYPPVAGELRGVWMHNYADPSWSEALGTLAQSNFNAVFPYMMSGGVAFYASQALSVHPKVATDGDFLAQAVTASRVSGVPVHARMLNLTTLFAPEPVKTALRQQGRLMVTAKGASSDWLCPTDPRNIRCEVQAALEMAHYGVAGIQFDYLRYPSADTCFCARCRAKFERDLGVKITRWPFEVTQGGYRGRFADWRRAQLTALVRTLSQNLRREFPGVLVSAAVFLNWEDHRQTFGQDWKAWVDEGLVDFVCPMDYTTDNARFTRYVERQREWVGGKVPLMAGIGVNADGHRFPGPERAVEQIAIARQQGARGFVIFNYCPTLVRDYLPKLALGVTRTPTAFELRPSVGLQGER